MASKLHEFIRALASRTEERKLNWEQTAEDDVYQVSFAEYVIKVFHKHTRAANGDNYCLAILNKDGTVVDTTDDDSLREEGFDDAYIFLKKLHDAARRAAMGVDKALDSLLSTLAELEDPPQVNPLDDIPF